MAEDFFGRSIEIAGAGLEQGMASPVRTVMETSSPGTESRLDAIRSILADLSQFIGVEANDQEVRDEKLINAVVNLKNDLANGDRSRSGDGKGDFSAQAVTHLEDLSNNFRAFYADAKSQNTIWVAISRFGATAMEQLNQVVRQCCPGSKSTVIKARDVGSQAVSDAKERGIEDAVKKAVRDGSTSASRDGGTFGESGQSRMARMANAAGATVAFAAQKVGEITGIDLWDVIPSATELNQYRINIRMLIHETQGFGRYNRGLEEGFWNIKTAANAAGVTFEVYGKYLEKNARRGMVALNELEEAQFDGISLEKRQNAIAMYRLERMKSVQTSALNTAQMLGMNASTVNDTFMDWHYRLGLSSLEMAEIGRHAQSIARTTGVTGDQLERAMRSADSLAKKLKQGGMFTSGTAKNVMEIAALSQKYGLEGMDQHMAALTSQEEWFNAGPGVKSFLAAAAAMAPNPEATRAHLQYGTALRPENFKDLSIGMERQMRELVVGHLASVEDEIRQVGMLKPGQSIRDLDLTNLTELRTRLESLGPEYEPFMAKLDTVLRRFNLDIGTVEQFAKSNIERGKSTTDRVQEMNKQLRGLEDGGFKESDQAKQIRAQLSQLQRNQTLSALTTMQKSVSGASPMTPEQIMNRLQKEQVFTSGEAREFMRDRPAAVKKMLDDMRAEITAGNLKVDIGAILASKGLTEEEAIKKLASGRSKDMEEALMAINQVAQEIDISSKRADDPVAQTNDWLEKIHNLLANGMFGLIKKAVDFLGPNGLIATKLIGALGGIGLAGWLGGKALGAVGGGGLLGRLLGGLGLRGGAGAAGKIPPTAGGIGAAGLAAILAKAFAILELGRGAYSGYQHADEAKVGGLEGSILGLLTGDSTTGTKHSLLVGYIREALGIKEGSAADDVLGGFGSMGRGAAIGATFGGVPGAAIGAGVGAGTEVYKSLRTANAEVDEAAAGMRKHDQFTDTSMKTMTQEVASIADAQKRYDEAKFMLSRQMNMLSGTEKNLKMYEEQRANTTDWFWINPNAEMLDESIASSKRQLESHKAAVKSLQDEMSAAESQLKKPATPEPSVQELKGLTTESVKEVIEPQASTGEKAQSNLDEILVDVHAIRNMMAMGRLSPQDLGLFDKNNIDDAHYEAMTFEFPEDNALVMLLSEVQLIRRGMTGNRQKALSSVEVQNLGLYDPSLVSDAQYETINETINRDFGYNLNSNIQSAMDVRRARLPELSSGNALNYRYETQEVVPLPPGTTIEDQIERRKYGEQGSAATSSISGMDEVTDYLTVTQSRKLDTMISELVAIREAMKVVEQSSVIGARPVRGMATARVGSKNFYMDTTRGRYELAFSDVSPGMVTSDGAGGRG